jgi:hypothetical protein
MSMTDSSVRPTPVAAVGRHARRWIGLALVAVLLRLALTADRDIVALNSPYDEFWFIHSAARWVWGGNYNQLAFAHLPLYSIWLAGLNLLGVPARLGIDLAWLVSTAYAGFALTRLTGKRWAGVAFWLFCAFHPVFIVLFDRALAETLLAVLVALMLGAGVEVWNTRAAARSRRGMLATGVFVLAFASAVHIRKECVLFLLPVLLLGAWSVWRRGIWWSSTDGWAVGTRLVAAPLLATFAVAVVLMGLNYLRWGMAVRYELAAPGYVRAIAALNRIDAGPGPLHVTVTRKSRELAYQHSPTFRELQGFFEGESGRSLAAHTAQYTGQAGEIGNGWFYWALRDAGAVAGWHRDARTADRKYEAIADELEAAFRSGALPAYPAWIPSFVDPDLGKWVGRVPASTWTILGLVLESDPGTVRPAEENASSGQMAEFIEIAGRRNPLPSVSLRGWIVLPQGSSVGLAPAGVDPANWVVLVPPVRPDVPGAFSFSLSMPAAQAGLQFVAMTPDGRRSAVPLASLRAGQMTQLQGAAPAALGVDELLHGKRQGQLELALSWWAKRPVSLDALPVLAQVYRVLSIALAVAMVAAWGMWAATRRVHTPVLVISGLIAVALLSRAGLLGVLDASSWSGAQVRYMAALTPAFAFMAILAAATVLGRRR